MREKRNGEGLKFCCQITNQQKMSHNHELDCNRPSLFFIFSAVSSSGTEAVSSIFRFRMALGKCSRLKYSDEGQD